VISPASYTRENLAARLDFLDGKPAGEHFIPETDEETIATLGSWECRIYSGALYKITTKGDDLDESMPDTAVPFRHNAYAGVREAAKEKQTLSPGRPKKGEELIPQVSEFEMRGPQTRDVRAKAAGTCRATCA